MGPTSFSTKKTLELIKATLTKAVSPTVIKFFNAKFNELSQCVHTVSDLADVSLCSDHFVGDLRNCDCIIIQLYRSPF